MPAPLVKSQPDEGGSFARVCQLCESKASLLKEEVVVEVCRLRESRTSLMKEEVLPESAGCASQEPA